MRVASGEVEHCALNRFIALAITFIELNDVCRLRQPDAAQYRE